MDSPGQGEELFVGELCVFLSRCSKAEGVALIQQCK